MLTNSFPDSQSATRPIAPTTANLCSTIVLQPRGCLDQATSSAFQAVLEHALRQATEAVIVDLIWVETIDPVGLEVLKFGVRLAHRLAKVLSFRSISSATRAAIELEKATLRTVSLGQWVEEWQGEFDSFLNRRTRDRLAALYEAEGLDQAEGNRTLMTSPATMSIHSRRLTVEQSSEISVAVPLQ